MKKGYTIEREGRQFGLETRIRIYGAARPRVGEQVNEAASPFFASKLICRAWALRHGYGWPSVH